MSEKKPAMSAEDCAKMNPPQGVKKAHDKKVPVGAEGKDRKEVHVKATCTGKPPAKPKAPKKAKKE